MNRRSVNYILPIVLGIVTFFVLRPLFTRAVAKEAQFQQDTLESDLEVLTTQGKDGFRQITFRKNGRYSNLTDSNKTNADPESDADDVVWMAQIGGYWQIFYYNATADKEVQLTKFGNNVNPDISGDYVVWEGMVDGVWQIFLFDGFRTRQLTSGDSPCQEVSVQGEYVVYAKLEDGGNSRIYLYDLFKDEETLLTPNMYGWDPEIYQNYVVWYSSVDRKPTMFRYVITTGSVQMVESGNVVQTFDAGAFEDFVDDTIQDTSPTDEFAVIDEVTSEDQTQEATESTSPDSLVQEDTVPQDTTGPETLTLEDIKLEMGVDSVSE